MSSEPMRSAEDSPEEVARRISENLSTMSPSKVFVYLREVLSSYSSESDALRKEYSEIKNRYNDSIEQNDSLKARIKTLEAQELGGFIITLDELLSDKLKESLAIDKTSNVQTAFMRIVERVAELEEAGRKAVETLTLLIEPMRHRTTDDSHIDQADETVNLLQQTLERKV